jgi:rubrerythrin
MAYDFNADEVFRIAEQIERNGAEFYNRVADKTSESVRRFFLDLSSMEKGHEKIFAAMRSKLTDADRQSGTFDPEGETMNYLMVLAGGGVFDEKARKAFDSIEGLQGDAAMEAALKAALDLEKDTVVFFLGLKDLVPDRLGREKLDSILKEEMKHIRLLGGRLSSIRK